MSIKISKHTKYIIDRLIADLNTERNETSTNDDVLWKVLSEDHPELADEAEVRLGKRVKPKRGRVK